MREAESIREGKAFDLLQKFEYILESDPLIEEVGFLHPSQFVTLAKEGDDNLDHGSETLDYFWIRDHKLGISTAVLLPLYNAAKCAFTAAAMQYKRMIEDFSCSAGVEAAQSSFSSSCGSFESEVMKHSRVLLLLSSDFGTAWNSRKLVVSKKQSISTFIDELLLSALVLSYSPKSEHAWCHRRWVIKIIAGKCPTFQEVLENESELVEKIAEKSKMNYRAWNHRCWIVSYMTKELVLCELLKSRDWAALHVADNSCFHYRRRLMHRMVEDSCHEKEDKSSGHNDEICRMWKEELDWNELLIKRYVGREALWIHRRFVSICWINHFAANLSGKSCLSRDNLCINNSICTFLDNEICLLYTCSTILDSDFEDFEAQAVYAVTYMLWLTKQIPESQGSEVLKKLQAGQTKTMLNEACSEKPFLHDFL
ncbi:hypothetical protein HS088_TW18G00962 [Tripterygium wilfordii]|uniref:Protein prenyltransferase alpha subunit repeat-containing protein 1 n=1 Tax=Tripterygium wilfordii TaxID=458696 RepID=A0A7J7CDV5_TRIWF|nr:protein prenyltransferase alpha subunit repeat-containing protein 1 [Tripterygium wilfordii]XP_038683653.1 protein prenyltransferase alpha subunit repeat-containing protein 1 [Tripterygium wilfordii]KAF5732270.1 hypothetical protein HS088_TW18G00962 [Tripterygium wilfordii]